MAKMGILFNFTKNSYSMGKLFGRLLLILTVIGFIGSNLAFSGNSNAVSSISSALCSVYSLIHTVIFIIGLVLIIVGGAMYAGAHILPGGLKGSLQGYGIGMIVGGIAGVVIALSAPYIMTTIAPGQSSMLKACAS